MTYAKAPKQVPYNRREHTSGINKGKTSRTSLRIETNKSSQPKLSKRDKEQKKHKAKEKHTNNRKVT